MLLFKNKILIINLLKYNIIKRLTIRCYKHPYLNNSLSNIRTKVGSFDFYNCLVIQFFFFLSFYSLKEFDLT